MEAGLNEEIFLNDGGDILVVCDVLCEDNECDRHISHCNGSYVGTAELAEAAECLKEGEVGHREEGVEAYAILNKCTETAEVDYSESVVAGLDADSGEHRCNRIAGEDADDEGDELCHLLAEYGADHGDKESYEAAYDSYIHACGRCAVNHVGALLEVADSIACERKTDYRNGGADNRCGHELVYPVNA